MKKTIIILLLLPCICSAQYNLKFSSGWSNPNESKLPVLNFGLGWHFKAVNLEADLKGQYNNLLYTGVSVGLESGQNVWYNLQLGAGAMFNLVKQDRYVDQSTQQTTYLQKGSKTGTQLTLNTQIRIGYKMFFTGVSYTNNKYSGVFWFDVLGVRLKM